MIEAKSSRQAIIRIDTSTIEQLIADGILVVENLTVPPSARVKRMWLDNNVYPNGVLNIVIEGEGLYHVCEGCEIPYRTIFVKD